MGVSMKDVAKLAGVSTATVSHVLNNTRNVNDETKSKVLEAVKELNYYINPVARNLRSGSSKIIGFVVSNLSNSFFMDIALTIDKIMSEKGYHLIYINSNEDQEKERENIENLMMHNIDGLVIAPVSEDCRYMNDLIGDNCPTIFFDRKPNGYIKDTIMSTNFEGAFEGTECLINKGHKRIGFIGSGINETMNERIDGFKSALNKHSIQFHENLVKCENEGSQLVNELKYGYCFDLAQHLIEVEKVTAILCGNSLAAVGTVNFIKEKNYHIPDEIGLTCFDDLLWLSMATPTITAIEQDRVGIGEKVAEFLLKRIDKIEDPIEVYRIPTKLIIRKSC